MQTGYFAARTSMPVFSFATHESLNTHSITGTGTFTYLFSEISFFFFLAVGYKSRRFGGLSGRSHKQEVLDPLARRRTAPGCLDVDIVDNTINLVVADCSLNS